MFITKFFNNLKITHKIFLVAIFSLITAVLILFTILPKLKSTIIDTSKKEMTINANLLNSMIKRLFDSSIENYLRGISETHLNTVQYYYTQYKSGQMTQDEALKECETILLSHKIGKSGYITSVDISKGQDDITLAIHPKAKGVNISKFDFVQDMYKLKQGYMEFNWKNPKEKSKRLKVMYMSYFDAWKWIVSAAPYKNELNSLIDLKSLNHNLTKTQLMLDGYHMAIFTLEGDVIYYPNIPLGTNISGFKDLKTGKLYIQDIIDSIKNNQYKGWEDFTYYQSTTTKPIVKDKTMYYTYLKEQRWIVAQIKNKDFILEPYFILRDKFITALSLIILSMLFIALVSSTLISNRIKELMKITQELSNNIYNHQPNKEFYKDEIGELEDSFNKAIHKISALTTKQEELNITLEHRVEDEVEKNRKKDIMIFEQSKMASMGEMIGNIAHQWRQPLSAISSSITGMKIQKQIGALTDESFFTTCDMINNNSQYLSHTIDDFKNFIKGERKKEFFILEDVINESLDLVISVFKTNDIQVEVSYEKDIEINGYKNELKQALLNIINNAKDALIDNRSENRVVFITTTSNTKTVTIKIKDNANGIPEDIIPNIFEPYFTTKHQAQGTGLGLYMTYNLIVDGMGGTIKIENIRYDYKDIQDCIGANFIINLPIV